MKTKRIKLPYGISNFKRLVRDNYYYVDKTKYVLIFVGSEIKVVEEVYK